MQKGRVSGLQQSRLRAYIRKTMLTLMVQSDKNQVRLEQISRTVQSNTRVPTLPTAFRRRLWCI